MSSKHNLGDIADSFNATLVMLMEVLDDCVSSDRAMYLTIKKKINTIMSTDPVYIMDSAGSYIYKYRDIISESEDSFSDFVLNTQNYISKDDSESAEKQAKTQSSDKVNFAKSILAELRSKWESFSSSEKKRTRKLVRKLLSEYCKYLQYLIMKDS